MTNTKPTLTIIIPSYNMEEYLEKCLNSLLDDRLKGNLQAIIINDGSKDRTLEIAREYEKKCPEIFEVIDKPNGGHGSVVNKGIENARGEFFRILDADDWVITDNLIKLIDFLKTTTSEMVIDEKREVNKETGNTQLYKTPQSYLDKQRATIEDITSDNSILPYIMLHTLSIRTSILTQNNVKVQEGVYYEDIEFIIKSTVHANRIEFVDLEIYQYLVGNTNQSVYYKNYVKNFNHHKTITRELVRYATEFQGTKTQKEYLTKRVTLLINTHLNIALIYNDNRTEGKKQAEEFEQYLKQTNPELYDLTLKRYQTLKILHALHVNYESLNKLKGLLNL